MSWRLGLREIGGGQLSNQIMPPHKKKLILFVASLALVVSRMVTLDKWASLAIELTFCWFIGLAGFNLGRWNLLTAVERQSQTRP